MTRFIKKRQDEKSGDSLTKSTKKSSSKKENKRKCASYKCGKDAIGAYTVDLDIAGVPFCKKHKSDVSSAVLWALLGVVEMSNNALGFPKNSKKKK